MGALTFARWCTKSVTALVPIFLGALFSISYVAYEWYYRSYGVSVDEVGLSYTSILLRQTSPALMLCVIVTLISWMLGVRRLRDLEKEYDELQGDAEADPPVPERAIAVARRAQILVVMKRIGGGLFLVLGLAGLLYGGGLFSSAVISDPAERQPGVFDPLRITVPAASITEPGEEERALLVLHSTDAYLLVCDPEEEETFVLPRRGLEVRFSADG